MLTLKKIKNIKPIKNNHLKQTKTANGKIFVNTISFQLKFFTF